MTLKKSQSGFSTEQDSSNSSTDFSRLEVTLTRKIDDAVSRMEAAQKEHLEQVTKMITERCFRRGRSGRKSSEDGDSEGGHRKLKNSRSTNFVVNRQGTSNSSALRRLADSEEPMAGSLPGAIESEDDGAPPPTGIPAFSQNIQSSARVSAENGEEDRDVANAKAVEARLKAAMLQKKLTEHASKIEEIADEEPPGAVGHAAERFSEIRKRAFALSHSSRFEMVFMIIILLSALIHGIEVELASINDQGQFDGAEPVFNLIGIFFTAAYTLELLLRLFGEPDVFGFFFTSSDRGFNNFDLAVVLLSWIEVISIVRLPAVRILRIFRVFRAARILKIVRYFGPLRQLIASIFGCIRSVLWSLILLLVFIYVFGAVFTAASTNYKEDTNNFYTADRKQPHFFFPSLHWSVFVLFQVFTGGQGWAAIFESLIQINWFWGFAFVAFVCFCSFVVLNVLTGFFCSSTMANQDHETVVDNFKKKKIGNIMALEGLLAQIDKEGYREACGGITISLLEQSLSDPKFMAFFANLEIDISDAWALFRILDMDGSGVVDTDEFVDGCMKLQGTAKSMDLATLRLEVKKMSRDLKEFRASIMQDIHTLVSTAAAGQAGAGTYRDPENAAPDPAYTWKDMKPRRGH